MNKAKEGMSWYSGGVVGILNGFFNIVSNGVNVLGVIAVSYTHLDVYKRQAQRL